MQHFYRLHNSILPMTHVALLLRSDQLSKSDLTLMEFSCGCVIPAPPRVRMVSGLTTKSRMSTRERADRCWEKAAGTARTVGTPSNSAGPMGELGEWPGSRVTPVRVNCPAVCRFAIGRHVPIRQSRRALRKRLPQTSKLAIKSTRFEIARVRAEGHRWRPFPGYRASPLPSQSFKIVFKVPLLTVQYGLQRKDWTLLT